MLINVEHDDRRFQRYLDDAETSLYKQIRPPIAHTMRLTLTQGSHQAREYLIKRGRPILTKNYRGIYRDAYRSVQRPAYSKAVKPVRVTDPIIRQILKQYGDADEDIWDADGISEFLREQLDFLEEEGGKRIRGIADTTVNEIMDRIMEGVRDGEDTATIASMIRSRVRDESAWQAARIARTEVHGAALAAINESITYKFDDETISEMQKTWWTAQDFYPAEPGKPAKSRVRPTHLKAHGQTVPFNEPFVVGDTMMYHPGDDSLGAGPEEIINCRCSVLYTTPDSSPQPEDFESEPLLD